MRERRDIAGEILTHAKPPVDDDVVYVHVSSEGEINGKLRRKEFVRSYRPIEIAGGQQTAIAWTTASSVVAIIEMVRAGDLPNTGFLKQEDVPFEAFLSTKTGSHFA
jgi:saccharopine dehydrogenase (NAD+, L-lysine-forming)